MSAAPLPEQPPMPLDALLALQDGVLTRRQALAAGLTPEAWEWRLRRSWQAPTPGVAVAHRGRPTDRELAWAAVLCGGASACLTGTWALQQQGWSWGPLGAVDVLVDRDVRLVPRRLEPAGLLVRYHRSAQVSRLRHPVHRPPVARVAVAALHAASWAGTDRQAESRLASVVQQRLVPVPSLRAALAEAPRLPRRAVLRALLDDVELGAHARSELDLLRLLRQARLPRPDRLQLRQRSSRLRYLDAWWERQRVVVEVDGAHHRFVGQWEDDLLRANAVQVDSLADRVVLLRLTGARCARLPSRSWTCCDGSCSRDRRRIARPGARADCRGSSAAAGLRGPPDCRDAPGDRRRIARLRARADCRGSPAPRPAPPVRAGSRRREQQGVREKSRRGEGVRPATTPGRPWCP